MLMFFIQLVAQVTALSKTVEKFGCGSVSYRQYFVFFLYLVPPRAMTRTMPVKHALCSLPLASSTKGAVCDAPQHKTTDL